MGSLKVVISLCAFITKNACEGHFQYLDVSITGRLRNKIFNTISVIDLYYLCGFIPC